MDIFAIRTSIAWLGFNGFLLNVPYSFYILWKTPLAFPLRKKCSKTFLVSKFVIDKISNCPKWNSIQGETVLKSEFGCMLISFWNCSHDYSLNCTLLGPITITNNVTRFRLLWQTCMRDMGIPEDDINGKFSISSKLWSSHQQFNLRKGKWIGYKSNCTITFSRSQ